MWFSIRADMIKQIWTQFPQNIMSLSVVLTAATGSVIIVTTIVRWVTSYNIHQASPTSLCHLQSEESNGAEEQFDAQPRSVWPVSRWDRSEARDLALTTRDLALTARSLALTTKDLLSLQEISLSLQEICSHCKRSALTARDLLSLSLLQVVLGCPATLVQVCFPAWPLPDVSVLCQVNTQHTIRSQWFLE